MKAKDGAVIIGLQHRGVENAFKTVSVLESHGLKKNDEVLLEFSPSVVDTALSSFILLKKSNSGLSDGEILLRLNPINQFVLVVSDFLKKKGAKVINLDYPRSESRNKRLLTDVLAKNKNAERSMKFIKFRFSIREKMWGKKVNGMKPAFALIGVGHISAVKKMIPFRKVVDPRRIGFGLLRQSLFEFGVRTKYNLIKRASRNRRQKMLKQKATQKKL
ncbi:MAG: hypothetical protein ABH986_04645 [archaeon]